MDPATVAAFVNLVQLGLTTFQQYSAGTISADQATQMLTQAHANLQNAINAFNGSGETDPPKA